MSVAIDADDSEALRTRVETEYRHDDPEVPDETEADVKTSSGYSVCC